MFCSVPVCICSSRSWLFEAGRIVCEGEPLGRCNAAGLFSLLGHECLFDGCMYGLQSEKPWKAITNFPRLAPRVNKICVHNYTRPRATGKDLKKTEEHTNSLAKAVMGGSTFVICAQTRCLSYVSCLSIASRPKHVA